MSRTYNYERLTRMLRTCSATEPLRTEQVRAALGLGQAAAHKAMSRMVQSGLAVRYRPGEYGPVKKVSP